MQVKGRGNYEPVLKIASPNICRLGAGIAFLDYMYGACEAAEFYLLARELEAAHNHVSGIINETDPELLHKSPEIIALLNKCAQITTDNGYHFLGMDFDELAIDVARLGSEFTALEEHP